MRLNEAYESIRGQILLMDPLPNVSRPYCMITRVETQRNATGSHSNSLREIVATANRSSCPSLSDGEFKALAIKSGYSPRMKSKKDIRRPKSL